MQFGSPQSLNLLWLLLPLALFLRWAWNKRLAALKRFGEMELVERLLAGVSREKQKARLWLLFGVFAFSLLALARPMWGSKEQTLISRGNDIFIALDVSRSMLAEDIKPNRLDQAKLQIAKLIDRMKGHRIGLIPFAGEAFTQCPLTLDYAAAKILLSEVNQNTIPTGGTAIGSAIEKALASFPPGERESRVIILITDGEDTVGDPKETAEKAKEEGVLIYAIGIGDAVGGPIPQRDDAGDLQEYIKDSEGNVVYSKLNEEALQSICRITGGEYFPVRSSEFGLNAIYEHIEQRRQQRYLESRFISQFEERYYMFLFPALLLLIVEMLLTDKKNAKRRTLGGFNPGDAPERQKS
ncbi:MAG: VWA domain-containing protein [Candidatus Hinthialibacter antarcticus]|nr:VWA domain-containing protein [Candidatus Hinthialibacter antarcticus]